MQLPTSRPYDLRHTWTSLRIAEKKLSIAEIAEQLGDKTSTVLDVYAHVMHEWRGRRSIDIEAEIRRARKRADNGAVVKRLRVADEANDSAENLRSAGRVLPRQGLQGADGGY